MQQFYTRYKEMKRVIRDDAAVDIQRCVRGFVVRSRISRFSGMIRGPKEDVKKSSKFGNRDVVRMDVGEGGFMETKRPSSFLPEIDAASVGPGGGLSINTGSMLSLIRKNGSKDSDDHTLDSRTDGYVLGDQSGPTSPGSAHTDPPEFLPGTMIPYDMYKRYRKLLEQKRDLKKELKMFDEKFSKDTGRVPKKTDKEVSEIFKKLPNGHH